MALAGFRITGSKARFREGLRFREGDTKRLNKDWKNKNLCTHAQYSFSEDRVFCGEDISEKEKHTRENK